MRRAVLIVIALLAGTLTGTVATASAPLPAYAQSCTHQASTKTTILDSRRTATETFMRMSWYSPSSCYYGTPSWQTWDRNCYSNFWIGFSSTDSNSCGTSLGNNSGGGYSTAQAWTTALFTSGYGGYTAHYQLYSIVVARSDGYTFWYCGRNYQGDSDRFADGSFYQYGTLSCSYHYDY